MRNDGFGPERVLQVVPMLEVWLLAVGGTLYALEAPANAREPGAHALGHRSVRQGSP